jgi:plastocyanin
MRGIRALPVVAVLACAAMWPAATAGAGGGCHSNATQGSGDTIEMSKMCFTPSVLRVEPGTEVIFVNNDPLPHNVSAPWGIAEDLRKGDRFTATFSNEGTFPYACTYHYGMTGAIVVGDGDGPGTGAVVEPGSVVDTTPISQESATAETGGSGRLGWVVAGAIGLLLGAGLTGMLRRKPDES